MEQIAKTISKMDDFLGAIKSGGFVSPEQAASLSGWSIQTVYNYIHLGKIPKHKHGKNLLINVDDLANLVFNQN
jgi:excisionase family DNA binding protein